MPMGDEGGELLEGEEQLAARAEDGEASKRNLPTPATFRCRWRSTTGQRGQEVLDELGITDVTVVGIAKRLEELWVPGMITQ